MTARRVLLDGLARDADIFELVSELAPLHPRDDTFPGEVFIRVAADALDWCGASRADPLPLEGLRERFLPECTFRGRENTKLQYAVLAAAALQGGTEPDLLDEVAWWQTDDFWQSRVTAERGDRREPRPRRSGGCRGPRPASRSGPRAPPLVPAHPPPSAHHRSWSVCRCVGLRAGRLQQGPVVRAVITMLCTWGCGRPCGPRWCSKEATTQRWGLTGENLLRPASCRSLSAA